MPPLCWCGAPASYVNPASCAGPATKVCASHVKDGYDLIRPVGAKVLAPVELVAMRRACGWR